MADFRTAIELVLKHEGGYTAGLAGDPGGETNFGISKRQYPKLDIKNLTKEAAIEIYRKDYWADWMGELDQQLANCLLDSAVNQGVGTMVRIRNLAGLRGKLTLKEFQVQRLIFYAKIGKADFYHSWFSRVLDV